MKRHAIQILALTVSLGLLTGCSTFARDYVSVHDYAPSVQEQNAPGDKINVRNYNALKQAILNMAYSGQTEGSIVFDAAYDGDTTEDMASACWTVRTQDALCAYCVENIAYEINKVVTINEATVYISYSKFSESPENIDHLAFSSEAETVILDALRRGDRRIALLVGRSGFSADDMAAQVIKAYRENPTVIPREPVTSVNIFSGTGTQRLYEIAISYGLTQEDFALQREQLDSFAPFSDTVIEDRSEPELALMACEYLLDTAELSEEHNANTAYDALVGHAANSEGLAFAFVELCHELGLDCRIVYGQHDWQEHCWNIVRLDGNYYHVDISRCIQSGLETGFLKNDEAVWVSYRWDVSSYPKCSGTLRLDDLFPAMGSEAEQTAEAESAEGVPGADADSAETNTSANPTAAQQNS